MYSVCSIMAHQSVYYSTFIDESVFKVLSKQLESASIDFKVAEVGTLSSREVRVVDRDSKVSWLSTEHWIGPLIWYYVDRANRENYRFDIKCIDGENMQLTHYGPGQYYHWHRDDSIAVKSSWAPATNDGQRPDWNNLSGDDVCRKLSFSLLLNDPSEYEGGQFQMMDYNNKMYEIPQEKGLLVIFDSTTLHRVRPVKKGTRKSLVGWVLGPRWR